MKYGNRSFIEKSKHWRHTSSSTVLKAYIQLRDIIKIFVAKTGLCGKVGIFLRSEVPGKRDGAFFSCGDTAN